MSNLLVVDWDYFFYNPLYAVDGEDKRFWLFDWGHRETNLFINVLWPMRAAEFIRHGFELPDVEVPENWWNRFNISGNAVCEISDSNMYSGVVNDSEAFDHVWLYDAHHDLFRIKTAEDLEAFRQSGEVCCEDWMFAHHIRGSKLHWRYPREANMGDEVPQMSITGIDSCIQNWLRSRDDNNYIIGKFTDSRSYTDTILILTTSHDYIFLNPGGMPVLKLRNDMLYLYLDKAYDLPDSALIPVQKAVAQILEKCGREFIPISSLVLDQFCDYNSENILIDRVGLNCVLHLVSKYNDKYIISGYDTNESPPLYFAARLPHKVDSYAEAIEALKPASVVTAEKLGIPVLRQGDIFFIATDYTTRDLKTQGATTKDAGIYGTIHTAQKLMQLPNGVVLARGVVTHKPALNGQTRAPDHEPLKLPDGKWYIAARNTVPIQ